MSEDIPGRVARLEATVTSIGRDLSAMGVDMRDMGGKIDRLVDGLSNTDGRAAERAHAVKTEIRDEGDRKAKDRSELFKSGLALIGAVAMVVGALCGPYLAKLDATSTGQQADTKAIGAVREVIAQQGADIGRNRDQAEVGRDKNRWQDEQLLDLNSRVSRIEGRAGAR